MGVVVRGLVVSPENGFWLKWRDPQSQNRNNQRVGSTGGDEDVNNTGSSSSANNEDGHFDQDPQIVIDGETWEGIMDSVNRIVSRLSLDGAHNTQKN